ncbi:MAG: AAA family ATPase, partial [Thermoleophilia bacterium]
MRIARIEAIAYGAIAGRVVEPEPGLTVIHGPNESGKSSTMQLIRGVLFGFPRLQGEGPRREPKGGGQRSGRVDIVTDDGRRLRIERAGSSLTVTDHEGVPVGDAAFAHALGIASAELFDRVQTFDAKDLAWMGLLDDPSVRASVLASAVLGGGAGAGPVLEGLQKRADALYLRQGEKQPYAHALKQATSARRALRDAEREAGTVERSSDAIAEAEQRVDAAHEQLVVSTRELQRLERLLELREALRALSALEAPADGVVEEPTADTLSTFRALPGDVPTAVEARRRAEQLRTDAADESARAQAGRSHLGLSTTAVVPALGDEAALRTAAETVREAEREATRLGDAARTIAAHVPVVVEQPSATPRRGLGAALIVISLLAIGAG